MVANLVVLLALSGTSAAAPLGAPAATVATPAHAAVAPVTVAPVTAATVTTPAHAAAAPVTLSQQQQQQQQPLTRTVGATSFAVATTAVTAGAAGTNTNPTPQNTNPAPQDKTQAARQLRPAVAPVLLQKPAELTGLRALLAGLTLTACVKSLCILGNFFWQVSPYPQVKRWIARGCTGEADAAPYVSIAFGGWQWCIYGVSAYLLTRRTGFLILVEANCVGAILGTWYVIAFFGNCQNEKNLNGIKRYLCGVVCLLLFQVSAALVLPPVRALFQVGLVSSFCSFLGSFAMLVTVPLVIETKDSKSIPAPVVTASFCCSMAWCVCGVLLADPLVVGPNCFATVSAAFCLYLKSAYPSSESATFEEEAAPEKPFVSKAMSPEYAGCSECDSVATSAAAKLVSYGSMSAEAHASPSGASAALSPSSEEDPEMSGDCGTGGTF